MKKLLIASSMLLAIGSTQAAESPKWDYVSGGFVTTKVDSERFNGIALTGSKLINENVFVLGGYSYTGAKIRIENTSSDLDVDQHGFNLGLGYRHAVNAKTDLFVTGQLIAAEAKLSYEGEKDDASEEGYAATAGFRSMVTRNVEVNGSLNYANLDGSETSVSAGALYHFQKSFAAGASVNVAKDANTFGVNAVYFF